MIDHSKIHIGRLGAALALATILAGCASGGAPQPTLSPAPTVATGGQTTAQPTAAPASTSTPQPTAAPATSAPAPTVAPASTSAPQPTAPPVAADPVAATQTVLEYYQAIQQQSYEQAYHLWAQNGAASGQSLDQFKQGFANTAGVDVQLASATVSGDAVSVPITLTAVLNRANQDQLVQHFSGNYTLRPEAGTWRIASANIAAVNPGPPANTADPIAVLDAYYAAINARDFARAFTYWSDIGTSSKQTFTQFNSGFATTDHVEIAHGQPQVGGAAGSAYAEVPIVIGATERNGTQQTFCGTYTLRHLNVTPFDEFGWHIYSAAVAPIAGVAFSSDAANKLLASGCKVQ